MNQILSGAAIVAPFKGFHTGNTLALLSAISDIILGVFIVLYQLQPSLGPNNSPNTL